MNMKEQKKNLTLVFLSIISLVIACFSSTIYANSVMGMAYWNFDEGTGTVLEDSWGNHNGVLHGAQWVSEGKVNGALAFNEGDYVEIGVADIGVPWTVATWVKYDHASTNTAAIMSSTHGAIKVEQYDNTAKVGYTQYGVEDYMLDYSVPVNEWTHLTFVGTTTGVKLYVNGQYETRNNQVFDCPMGKIGTGVDNTCDFFSGILDELKIYSTALDSEQIASLAEAPYTPPVLSKGNEEIIEKGLQIQAWVTTDETNRYDLNPDDWDAIGFTAPTYYEEPMYNSDFHTLRPNAQWSLAKAPFADQLSSQPTSNDHFLSDEQRANLDNLVSMCFGDEEPYSPTHADNLKAWYTLSKSLYPNVLVHSNQYAWQWSEANLRSYMQDAKPDILSFDMYYYDENETPGYRFINSVAKDLALYRKVALEGYDGTGESPIVFGQYLLGFKTGTATYLAGDYRVSESQLNLIPYATVTMGGKWLNYFRWAQDKDFCLLYNQNGQKTDTFYQYAQMAKEIRNLGPHLTRLNSTDVYMVQGEHKSGDATITNPLPSNVPAWQSSADYYITDIVVANIGTVNDGLAGDIMVGYFNPLLGLTEAMKNDVFTSENPQYFMLMNCLVNHDGLKSSEKDKGTSSDSKQHITLTMDLGSRNPNTLKKVDRETGNVQSVTLTPLFGTTYELQLELGGGKGDLFFWE